VWWLLLAASLAFASFVTLAVYTNVSTSLTQDDITVFESQLDLRKPLVSLTYSQELALIRSVQSRVWAKSPPGNGIAPYEDREPASLLKTGNGSCYDISRTLDKAYMYLGFKSRHVYLLFRGNRTFLGALFHYGQPSHAVTEVMTSKGWLFVDSISPWIAVTKDGEPVGADDVWKRLDAFEKPPAYLRDPWWAIRGMYSRKGQFYKPYMMFPQFSWPDFLDWLVAG